MKELTREPGDPIRHSRRARGGLRGCSTSRADLVRLRLRLSAPEGVTSKWRRALPPRTFEGSPIQERTSPFVSMRVSVV